MAIKPKDFDHLLGRLKLSDKQLKAHFKLYEGYVRKLNEIADLKEKTDKGGVNYSFGRYSELLRREPTAYNGTVLHELYFGNLTEQGKTRPDEALRRELERAYGSVDDWIEDVKAGGTTCHGWVLAVWDPFRKKLGTNLVYREHDTGLWADASIVMALDVWEHAYMIDFQTSKGEYMNAFFENLDWSAMSRRLETARRNAEVLEPASV